MHLPTILFVRSKSIVVSYVTLTVHFQWYDNQLPIKCLIFKNGQQISDP